MSMYIYASLPEPYGTFNQIRKDNYPFNRLFPKYLRTLVQLGKDKDMDIFSLLGYIENELSEEDRLPDLPISEETLNFRFPIEDKMIEDYYRDQDLTNKMITQMIIRTTIRLTEVYGTSLSRIGALITGINNEEVSREKDYTPRETVKVNKRKKTPIIKVDITEPADRDDSDNEEDSFDSEGASRSDLLQRIDELTKKGSELVERSGRIGEAGKDKPDKEDKEDTDDKVVETNPHLMSFL